MRTKKADSSFRQFISTVHFDICCGMEGFYIHLSSKDSRDMYPRNGPSDFIAQLPERVNLYGTWKCALAEIEYSCSTTDTSSSLLVNSDLCDGSMVGDKKVPILRRFRLTKGTYNEIFPLLHYYPIKAYSFDTIHLYINTDTGERASFLQDTLKATLHFRNEYKRAPCTSSGPRPSEMD